MLAQKEEKGHTYLRKEQPETMSKVNLSLIVFPLFGYPSLREKLFTETSITHALTIGRAIRSLFLIKQYSDCPKTLS